MAWSDRKSDQDKQKELGRKELPKTAKDVKRENDKRWGQK